ncbi:unnamed protein product [Owenia fusiformis]|uniref:Cytochrome P450 n=1 Tax=Owenia fusiformis TaxID=6347 RepID=A0A8S4N357_OWEFU|nr:unnamed protein product [Owenia fusiformis]
MTISYLRSMVVLYVLAALVAAILYYYITHATDSKSRILSRIPGPKGIPILGNALQIDMVKIHDQFLGWSKTYGEIFLLNLAGESVVVLNSHEAINEALIRKSTDFAGRPGESFRIQYLFSQKDIIFRDFTDDFKRLKKIVYKGLRYYGDEKEQIIRIATEEIDECMRKFSETDGMAFDPDPAIYVCIINILVGLIEGKRLDETNKRFADLVEMQDAFTASFSAGKGAEIDMFPFLRFFGNETFKSMQKGMKYRNDIMEEIIEDSKKDYDPDNKRHLLDHFISEMTFPEGSFDKKAVIYILGNLYGAGLVTSHVSFATFLLTLITYPDVQKKLQNEVDTVIGQREVKMEYREEMPYLNATLLELLRYISHVPLAVPHKTTVDTSVVGYDIPKNTQVFMNLYAMHHDDSVFRDPWEFKPERWLDDDGQLVSIEERNKVVPFGGGRRACPGELLATTRMFLFSANILKRFNILPVEGEPACPDPRGFKLGIVLEPNKFKIRAVKRL